MVVTIIGFGLIGGSLAISLKENGFAKTLIGVDHNPENIDKAFRRRLLDETTGLLEGIRRADLVIVAIPVDSLVTLLPKILDEVTHQVVIDVGSTKEKILEVVAEHPKRDRFVGTHPMAGTEHSGPEAAIPNLFDGKACVLCEVEKSDPSVVEMVERMYQTMDMKIVQMNPKEHDVHTAYVSHISHLSAFALALTVLEKEKNEARIFELASGGFSSTVRLAKSTPNMWVPIFAQNQENLLDVLDEHINTLAQFRTCLIKKDFIKIHQLIEKANSIRKILK